MTFLFTQMGGAIMVRSGISLLINAVILILFRIAPLILRKVNPFGPNEYITFR